MDEEYTYTVIQYFVFTFTFKPILDIILSYFMNKFKDKKNNLLLFYSITFGLYFLLFITTNFNFLPSMKRYIDFINYFVVVFILFYVIDLIATAIYFKKNKKIFITLLSTAFFLFISYIIYTCMGHCSKICEIFLDINDHILVINFIIIFILKTIFSAIYTLYLMLKLCIKIKNDIKNKRI